MRSESLKSTLVVAGAIVFNIIFWNEKVAINSIVFDAFILGIIFYLYPRSTKNSTSQWLLASHLITAAMVVFQNTIISKIGFSITLLLFIAFTEYAHRSVWYASGSILLNYIFAVPDFINGLRTFNSKNVKLSGWSRPFRILLIPFLLFIIFSIIYLFANTVLSNIAGEIVVSIQNWFKHFFDWFSLKRFEFFLLGIFIVAGLILKSMQSYFSVEDLKRFDDLSRKKDNLKKFKQSFFADVLSIIIGKRSTGVLALKNEFTIGCISLMLLNLLLLLINIIDIKYLWLGFTFKADINLSTYVHEGAGLLILSIVLAMFVLLFFFRANLNFYRKNKWLRYGAYLWILQNLFLVMSVVMRNYYYIAHYGLAYKRIGLLFFLAMVLSGLITVFFKIYNVKTTYYLLRVNAWVGIILLVFASTIHWDEMIAKYNLARKSSISLDVQFLLSLSDKTLPILEKNKDVFDKDISAGNKMYYEGDYYNALEVFEYRKKDFFTRQKQYSWLSWNVADAYVKKELTSTHISLLK